MHGFKWPVIPRRQPTAGFHPTETEVTFRDFRIFFTSPLNGQSLRNHVIWAKNLDADSLFGVGEAPETKNARVLLAFRLLVPQRQNRMQNAFSCEKIHCAIARKQETRNSKQTIYKHLRSFLKMQALLMLLICL